MCSIVLFKIFLTVVQSTYFSSEKVMLEIFHVAPNTCFMKMHRIEIYFFLEYSIKHLQFVTKYSYKYYYQTFSKKYNNVTRENFIMFFLFTLLPFPTPLNMIFNFLSKWQTNAHEKRVTVTKIAVSFCRAKEQGSYNLR